MVIMKNKSAIIFAALLSALLTTAAYAGKLDEVRGEADQYYTSQEYNKAYKVYFKLARIGDHYAQDRIATMYAEGHGKRVDLQKAYAWEALAAEGGDQSFVQKSKQYLEQAHDKAAAEKEVEKLKKKYGKVALEKKAQRRETRKASHAMGGCTGRRLGCSDTK